MQIIKNHNSDLSKFIVGKKHFNDAIFLQRILNKFKRINY